MQNNTAAENWAAAQATAKDIAAEMIAGRDLTYAQADELGEQTVDELRKALKSEGYTLSTEDTEVMWAEEDE